MSPPSRLFRVSSARILAGRSVVPRALQKSLEVGLCGLLHTDRPDEAWQRILKADDRILIKFNQSGAQQIGTTPALAQEIVRSLTSAGWSPERITLLEAGDETADTLKVRRADKRYAQEVTSFGDLGDDSFIADLHEATALINVPFLKTHPQAGMTCCLKNLSHGLIRRPANFHGPRCKPAIARIVASDHIRQKLRLNIVNCLRIVFDKGPAARETDILDTGSLVLTRDPVAADSLGCAMLNAARSQNGLRAVNPGNRPLEQLILAKSLGLGEFDLERVELAAVQV